MWLTTEQALKLWEELGAPGKAATLYLHAALGHIRRLHPRGSRYRPQKYHAADVRRLATRRRPSPPLRGAYRRNSPPPEGWYTLREVAALIGCGLPRLNALCTSLSLCTHMWQGRRYTHAETARTYMVWRPQSFCLRHKGRAWTAARLDHQRREHLTAPEPMRYCYSRPVFAPELLHL